MTHPQRQLWLHVTSLGDSAVMLPCIALVVLWLAIPRATRRLAWQWLVWVAAVVLVVCATKLAFMGWLVSLPGLDFTGLSGHSALAMMVWPALGGLAGRRHGPRMQAMGVFLGVAIAALVGWSRLVLHAHSPSEVVLAWLLSTTASLAFLWRHRRAWCLPERTYVAVLSMLVVLPFVYGHRFPSQAMLGGVARQMTGHRPYKRRDLRRFRQEQAEVSVSGGGGTLWAGHGSVGEGGDDLPAIPLGRSAPMASARLIEAMDQA